MKNTYFKKLTVKILNDEYIVIIFLGNIDKTWRKVHKWFPELDKGDLFENTRGHCFMFDGECPVIWIGVPFKDSHFYSTLAHEAVHAIDHIFKLIGEGGATHEIFAHCVGAVVANVERLIKCKKK